MTFSTTPFPKARSACAGLPFLLTALAAAAAGATEKAPAAPDSNVVLVAQANTQAGGPVSAAPAEKASAQVIEVTASKRKERLLDAPTALSAINGEKLENLGVTGVADYITLVPSVAQNAGASPGQGMVVMRGLYTGAQQLSHTTGYYIGDAPVTPSSGNAVGGLASPDPDMLDVARIEVLKGPQGTLYGASALGGLIRVVPTLPDSKNLSGKVRLGLSTVSGGGNGDSASALVNVPVASGLLGLQVGAFARKEGGFITNSTTRQTHLGESKSSGGSFTAMLTPTKELQLTLRALTQKLDSDGPQQQDNLTATGKPATGERQFASVYQLPFHQKLDIVEGAGEYQLAQGTLSASFSQVKSRNEINRDFSTNYAQLFTAGGAYCLGFGICAPTQDYRSKATAKPDMDKQSAEVRFTSKRLGAVEFLGGVFYTKEDTSYFVTASGTTSNGTPVAAPFNSIITSTLAAVYKETAAFGNLTYYFTDEFDLTGGVRRASNKQDASNFSTGLLGQGQTPPFHTEDSSTTYQVTARYRPTRDLSTFARVSSGYRPGGPNVVQGAGTLVNSFRPDTVTNYEAGVKGKALDGRLNFDASAYRIDWKDVQLNGLINGFVAVGNAGKATVDGFEMQGSYNDPSGLSVGGSLGYNKATLKQVGSDTAAYIGAAAGDRLPGTPKLTAALYADYAFAAFGKAQANVGATVRHQSEKPSSYPAATLDPFYMVPAYTLLDLRASVQWDKYSLRVGVANATNKNAITGYTTNKVLAFQTVNSWAYLNRPRTLSVTLGVDF